MLRTSKIGHRNQYTAVISEQEYQAAQTENFIRKVYEGDAKGLVSTLVQMDLLTAGDYEELKKYWHGGDHLDE